MFSFENFNLRQYSRLSTCKVNIIRKSTDCENEETCRNRCLKGGIKLNFDFVKKKLLSNEISLDSGSILTVHTEFEFSKKAKLVLPLCSHDTAKEVLETVVKKFHMVDEQIYLYERELSLTQSEIFYRQLENTESPLNSFISWKLNQERKSLVITDHDPNARKYEKYSNQELEDKLESLNLEETQLIESVQDNYEKAKSIILDRLCQIKVNNILGSQTESNRK